MKWDWMQACFKVRLWLKSWYSNWKWNTVPKELTGIQIWAFNKPLTQYRSFKEIPFFNNIEVASFTSKEICISVSFWWQFPEVLWVVLMGWKNYLFPPDEGEDDGLTPEELATITSSLLEESVRRLREQAHSKPGQPTRIPP